MNHQRWDQEQGKTEKRPSKVKDCCRRGAIKQLRIQREQAASEKTRQCEAQEEEDPLEIALAAVPQNHHHPEKWQQRSRSQGNQAKVEEPVHRRDVFASLTLQSEAGQ
jgi:hypothetical protein